MKGKKSLFLFLALLFPVAIFIFLKIFGRNEFAVPLLHEEEVNAPPECNFEYRVPYRIADSLRTRFGMNDGNHLFVVYLEESQQPAVNRVSEEFRGNPVAMIDAGRDTSLTPETFRSCVLLMAKDENLALVDSEGRIRGYYDGDDRDEVDRLIVEAKIILNKY